MTSEGKEIIAASISLACIRWNKDVSNFPIDQFCKDLQSTFGDTKLDVIIKAIKKGSLGAYGNIYDLSIGQIFIWIRKSKDEIAPHEMFTL